MSGRIIVGLNGSKPSEHALDWAAARAAATGDSLVLVHAIDPSITTLGAPKLVLEAQEAGRNLLDESARRVAERYPDLEVSTQLRQNAALPEVFAQFSRHASLIVVGSDSTGVRRESPARGTSSLRVAAASEAPVLIIPAIDVTQRHGIVVGVDGSEVSENAIEFAANEASRSGEPLIAVYAWVQPSAYGFGYEYTLTSEFRDRMQQASEADLERSLTPVREKYPKLEIEKVVVNDDPTEALLDQGSRARLVVVGSHGRGAFRRLLLGSVSHGVLSNLVAPTAVYR